MDYCSSARILRTWNAFSRRLLGGTPARCDLLAITLAKWAKLSRGINNEDRQISWKPCSVLINQAELVSQNIADKVSRLIQISEAKISQDPLTMDFALHRWLASDREEAYSDWLKWVLEELNTLEAVGRIIYGNRPPEKLRKLLLACQDVCNVEREVIVDSGHEGRTGRLDLVVRFANQIVILIEIKVVGADSADTVKQSGYRRWLDNQEAEFKDAILLAVDGDCGREYQGFKLLLWEEFCARLRRLLPDLIGEGRTISSSLIAGFVGAVEQNLVGFPSLRILEKQGKAILIVDKLAKVKTYLEAVLLGEGSFNEPA